MNTINLRRATSALCVLLLLTSQLAVRAQQQQPAQPPQTFALTVDSIMRGPRLVGYQPGGVYWSQDSQRVYFRWKQADEPRLKEMGLYVVNRDGTNMRRLTEEEARLAPPANGELSKDKTLTVFTEEGDIFIYDHAKGERRQITRTTDTETNAHFTADQRRIYFTRQNNLYVIALDGGSLVQLTDIRTGGGGSSGPQTAGGGGGAQRQGGGSTEGQQRGTDSQEYLKKEERELFEAVRERAVQREEQEAKRKAREKRKPFNVPAGQGVTNLLLAPDGTYVVATITEPGAGAKNTIVPNFVTESAYTEDIPGRTKVGDTQGRARLVIINAETGDVKNIDHGQREVATVLRTRTELNATEQAQRERGDAQGQTGQPPTQQTGQQEGQQAQQTTQQGQPPRAQTERVQAAQPRDRDVQLAQLQWSEDGKNAVMMARSADNKDRWVLLLDAATGKTKPLAQVHDDAWVDGPGAFTLGWLPDNQRVFFESERDGFAHLYTVAITGGEPSQLTSGPFEVSDVRLSADKTKFYFTSSEGSPFERHLYSMPIAGGARTRLTTLAGNNQVDISPDETMLANVYSYSNKPPELYLVANQPASAGAAAAQTKQVTTSPLPEFFTYNWIDPPIVNFKARDGATVHARLYKPANWQRGGPAVLFVHGAGYLQNVHKWWSQYYREYMFHHLLMDARLHGARHRLSRLGRLRARLAHGHLSPHGRQGPDRSR